MRDEVVIIAPEAERGAGGLADYAWRVVEEWGDRAAARFLVPNESSWLDQLPRSGGRVLLHYSAYGFDRIGYPRRLLNSLGQWKLSSGGLLAIMFHEIWTFWPLLNKNRLVQRMHRADLGKLIAVADAVFTSTASQTEHLLKLAPTTAVQVLPVGSNIRPLSNPGAIRAEGLAVLFGLQGSRIKALRTMQKDLRALSACGLIKRIVTIGGGTGANDEEGALLSELNLTEGLEMRGALPEEEISTQLSAASFALSAQDELSLQKSGTFMAYAAHGLNIISPAADPMAPEPLCWLTRAADLLEGADAKELEQHAENLRAWQERTSFWPEIAERFADALHLSPTP